MPSPPPPEMPGRGRNLTGRLVDTLGARIRDGALQPGDRMPPEPELIREFAVSRTVVREALQRLAAQGLIETQHGVGSFVRRPPPAATLLSVDDRDLKLRDLLAMLELRICVEVEAAGLAALRRSDEHLTRMQAALDGFESHRRAGASTAQDDYRFHVEIANATGNPFFEQVLSTLSNATLAHHRAEASAGAPPAAADPDRHAPFPPAFPTLGRRKELALMEHQAIHAAIRAGDAASARAAMTLHLSNSRDRLRTLLGTHG